MKYSNNLIDKAQLAKDSNFYAVNLWLKSGQKVYLEDLTVGEKDAYLQYVKSGQSLMIISMGDTMWRLLPNDIERIEVKAYTESTQKSVYPLLRIFLAKSRIATETFAHLIRLYLLVIMISVFAGVAKAFKDGDLMGLLFDPTVLSEYILWIINWLEKGFLVVFFAMAAVNVFDFILKPLEKYHVIDSERSIFAGSKTAHLMWTVSFAIAFIVFKQVLMIGLSLIG